MDRNELRNRIKIFAKEAVGVPFVDKGRTKSGWDCWGMVVILYKECFGIEVFDANHSYTQPLIVGRVARAEAAQNWQEIPIGQEQPGDVILTRPCHAGVILDRPKMINCYENMGTVIERYDHSFWKYKIIGIYRHGQLTSD